ncbi:MAG TPA: energy transducer TonB [Flavitalea sp.]|nr:energy transducer TonB [Flavitalea sp.]
MYRKFLLLILIIPSLSFAQQKDTTVKATDDLFEDAVDASFPGGLEGWQNYLIQNMRYPRKAMKKEIQGTVVVQFIIDTNGKTSEIEAIEGPEILAAEAIRLIKESGKWLPAHNKDKPLKSYKRQPFVFKLEKG